MDEHPIPHSITTFEFKLIGFLSVKQFLYLLFFGSLGYLFYLLIAIPYVNLAIGLSVAAMGVILAFVKYNERTIDIHIKNMYKRLTSPSQYYYKKTASQQSYLQDVRRGSDPRVAALHVQANEKVALYLKQVHAQPLPNHDIYPPEENAVEEKQEDEPVKTPIEKVVEQIEPQVPEKTEEAQLPISGKDTPVLSGYIKTKKELPLPDIIVYLKDSDGKILRIMKTNAAGYFATFHALPSGSYILEPRDTRGKHFFDTMNLSVAGVITDPIMVRSKEIL